MNHRFQLRLGARQRAGRPIMKRRGAALAAALLATSLSACNDRSTNLVERAAFVRTAIVQPRDRQASLTLTGEVQARFCADLSFRLSGRVLARLVDVGARVNAGDVLARLDPAEQQAELDAAIAGGCRGGVPVARRPSHVCSAGLSHVDWFHHARGVYDQAQQDLRSAESTLESAKAQLGTAREALDDTELHARASGVITARSLEVGQVVQAAQTVFTLRKTASEMLPSMSPESMFFGDVEDGQVSLSLVSDPDVTAVGLSEGSFACR